MKNRNHGQSRVRSVCKRMACCFFAFVMVSMTVLMSPNTSLAAGKDTKSRAIAIVFDNSGSMYNETAWSRAIYAMEVFASMANEGDKIWIYPMNPIETNGESHTSSDPLKIDGGEDAVAVIRNIVTPDTGDDKDTNTPIESITHAYDGLDSEMSAAEKWLIVLTDGDKFYDEDGAEMTMEETKTNLSQKLSAYNNSVNVMYLGIGSGATEPDVSGSMQHDVVIAADSQDILTNLTNMCNVIYGRDEMETDGKSVDFDGLTMTKLILFVQGNNISDLSLKNESGNEVETTGNPYNPSYTPEEVHENDRYNNAPTDETLSGQISIYENVPAGKYTIDYKSGADSDANVAVYYEPDVSIGVHLMDEDDKEITNLEEDKDKIYPGNYTLQYGLVNDAEEFTASELLGDRKFEVECSVNGKEVSSGQWEAGKGDSQAFESIALDDLKAGDSIQFEVTATYLDGYTVSADSSDHWPFPIDISESPGYAISAEMEADSNYTISDLNDDKAGPIVVNITHEGEKLSAEDMANVSIDLTCQNDEGESLSCDDWIEKDEGNSRYLIYPKMDESEEGKYDLKAVVTYTDEYGKEDTDSDSKSVEFSKCPVWIRYAIIGLILLIILAIILFIMTRKVLPKGIVIQTSTFKVNGTKVPIEADKPSYQGGRKNATLTVTSPTGPKNASCSITLTLEALSRRYTASREREIQVTNISVSPDPGITYYEVNGEPYKLKNGKWINADRGVQDDEENIFNFKLLNSWDIEMKGEVSAGVTDSGLPQKASIRFHATLETR